MKKLLSVLAIAAMTASITSIATPAEAGKFGNLLRSITRPEAAPVTVPAPDNSNNTPAESTPSEEAQPAPVSVAPIKRTSVTPECIKVDGSDIETIAEDSEESKISIGRRLIPVSQRINGGHELTCRTRTVTPNGKVRFRYGIADNSNVHSARVTAYVGGQKRINRIIRRGEIQIFELNMSRSDSYAVTVEVVSSGFGSHYIHLGNHSYR